MAELTEESLMVLPNIGLLNQYAQKAKKVAITSINPVFSSVEAEETHRDLMALRIQIEGPAKYLSYFHRLLDGANLKFTR